MPGRKKQVQTLALMQYCIGVHSTCHCAISSWYMGITTIKSKLQTSPSAHTNSLNPPKKNDLSCNATNKQQEFTIPGRTWLQIHPNSSSIHFDSFLLCLEQQPHSHHPQSHTLAHGEGGLRQGLSSPCVHLDLQGPKRWQLTFEISKACQVLLMEEIPNNHPTCMTPGK